MAFEPKIRKLPEEMYQSISDYIRRNYALSNMAAPCCLQETAAAPMERSRRVKAQREEKIPPACGAAPVSLEGMLKNLDAGFSETLLKCIDRAGKKDSEIYKKANLSKQHFSKIRNNPDYKPTKATAIALALALELNLEETKDLIGRAGYALTNSSRFDLILRYFIEQGNYNVVEINIALYEFDQIMLGAQ